MITLRDIFNMAQAFGESLDTFILEGMCPHCYRSDFITEVPCYLPTSCRIEDEEKRNELLNNYGECKVCGIHTNKDGHLTITIMEDK